MEAGFTVVKRRERKTRAERWEEAGRGPELRRQGARPRVVAEDQIRTVVRAWRDRLFTEIFPGRKDIPKTSSSPRTTRHAEDIVRIVREEFGRGNDFCQKITYKVTGVNTDDLISAFRNSYHPRIAVTVDMISTGTDIKPVECLLFMRVGIVEHPKLDPEPLERQPSVPFHRLLEQVALGLRGEDLLASLASRLARLRGKLSEQDSYRIAAASGGLSLQQIVHRLLDAIDPDVLVGAWSARSLAPDDMAAEGPCPSEPTAEEIAAVAAELAEQATRVFDSAELRRTLIDIQARDEQTIDVVSIDQVREAGFSADATAKALATVDSFRQFILERRDQIAALEIIYGQPYGRQRLTYSQLQELAQQLQAPPHVWTTEALWRAYAQLERDRVRGVRAPRVLTDLVSLVRHAVQLDDELAPYPDRVWRRYEDWLLAQEQAGRTFTPQQRWWLDRIAEHIGVNLALAAEDLDYGEFFNRGGRLGAARELGAQWLALVDAMNEALVV
jgi:type I restriction enzyme R subunit